MRPQQAQLGFVRGGALEPVRARRPLISATWEAWDVLRREVKRCCKRGAGILH